MGITIMTGSEFGGGVDKEIGKANRAFFRRDTGGAPPMPMSMGTHLRYDHGSPDITIVLEGYKTPMPQNTGSGLSRGAVSDLLKAQAELAAVNANLKAVESQLDDANLAIAVLVNMLGGSVTISSSEVENANKFELTATKLVALQDVLVLSVREK